jgi:hypothetical protein
MTRLAAAVHRAPRAQGTPIFQLVFYSMTAARVRRRSRASAVARILSPR